LTTQRLQKTSKAYGKVGNIRRTRQTVEPAALERLRHHVFYLGSVHLQKNSSWQLVQAIIPIAHFGRLSAKVAVFEIIRKMAGEEH